MKKRKSKSLGQGFLRHLRILEVCEQAAIKMNRISDGSGSYQFYLKDLGDPIQRVFLAMGEKDPNSAHFVQSVVERWANDAADLRESFKFQIKDSFLLGDKSYPEVEFIMPFEKTALIVHVHDPNGGDEKVELVFYVELRTTPEDYNDLSEGDPFYSITTSIYKPDTHYGGIFPFEVHIPYGQIIPSKAQDLGRIKAYLGAPEMLPESMMDELYKVQLLAELHVCRFVQLLAIPEVRKVTVPGLKPGITHVARKRKYPMYEHTTVEIDLTPEQMSGEGKFRIEGRHHRLHPVRGHWRTFKSGKKTWIKEHWRGDDNLGVVTHDYEITDHEG